MRYDWNTMLPEKAFQPTGKHMTLEGKGSSPPPPDYRPLAAASEASAQMGLTLGTAQLAEARRQYDLNQAVANPVVQAQLATMAQTQTQGQDYYNYMKQMQRPVEGALTTQSMGPDTSAASLAERGLMTGGAGAIQADPRYAQDIAAQAGQAGADQMSGYTRALNVAARQGMRYGFDPAKLAAQAASQAGGQSSAVASAMNQARTQATEQARGLIGTGRNLRLQDENLGWGRKMDVAGLYRGLPGASQGAYQTGIAAGQAATGSQMAPGQAYMAGMGQSVGTQMQGQGQKVQGLSGVLGSQNQIYGQQLQANAAESAGMGQAIGTIGGAAAAVIL